MPSQIKVDEIKNVAGQYKIKTNVFEGQTTAGSIALQGEGTATTNLQQGVAKSWCNLNGQSTAAIQDSFNTTSMSDAGTGLYDTTFTNNMNNDDYCATGAAGELVDNGGNRMCGIRARTTSGVNIRGFQDGNSASDLPDMNVATHGDLA